MDYYGTARTNYFKVKNAQAFKDAVDKIPGISYEISRVDNVALFGLFSMNDYGWVESYYDDDGETEIEIDWEAFFKKHLHGDSVAIMLDVGNEGRRYLNGYAFAWNAKGDTKVVSLNNIYELAEELGTVHTRAEW
jgi:hypothetical protein